MPGSHQFYTQTGGAYSVDSGTRRPLRPNPQHSERSSVSHVLSGRKRGIVGVGIQPPGLRSNPTFPPANSPVSPVDREHLLTAGLSVEGPRTRHSKPG